MRSRLSVVVSFLVGCAFTVALLVRCGAPQGGGSATGTAAGGAMGMPSAMAGGASIRTITAACDHLVGSPDTGIWYAVADVSGFDPSQPNLVTAMTCGSVPGSMGTPANQQFPPSEGATPSGWIPRNLDCASTNVYIAGTQAIATCWGGAYGHYDHATFFVQ